MTRRRRANGRSRLAEAPPGRNGDGHVGSRWGVDSRSAESSATSERITDAGSRQRRQPRPRPRNDAPAARARRSRRRGVPASGQGARADAARRRASRAGCTCCRWIWPRRARSRSSRARSARSIMRSTCSINNAGMLVERRALRRDRAEVAARQLRGQRRGPFLLTQALTPHLARRREGRQSFLDARLDRRSSGFGTPELCDEQGRARTWRRASLSIALARAAS